MRLFNRRAMGLAVLLVAVVWLPIASASASSTLVRSSTSGTTFHNLHDARCLDEDVSTPTHDGSNVQAWDCNGWDNQDWTYYTDGTIRNSHDGRCLDEDTSSPTHNGSNVQVWHCNGWDNQIWTYYTDGTICSAHDGRCLDEDVSAPTHNGTNVQTWDYNDWYNQQWDHP
jgi:hypothetical protein